MAPVRHCEGTPYEFTACEIGSARSQTEPGMARMSEGGNPDFPSTPKPDF